MVACLLDTSFTIKKDKKETTSWVEGGGKIEEDTLEKDCRGELSEDGTFNCKVCHVGIHHDMYGNVDSIYHSSAYMTLDISLTK